MGPGFSLRCAFPRPFIVPKGPLTGFSYGCDKGRNRTPFGFGGQEVVVPYASPGPSVLPHSPGPNGRAQGGYWTGAIRLVTLESREFPRIVIPGNSTIQPLRPTVWLSSWVNILCRHGPLDRGVEELVQGYPHGG